VGGGVTCQDTITAHYWVVLWLFDTFQAGAIIGIWEFVKYLWRLTKWRG